MFSFEDIYKLFIIERWTILIFERKRKNRWNNRICTIESKHGRGWEIDKIITKLTGGNRRNFRGNLLAGASTVIQPDAVSKYFPTTFAL